LSTHASVYISSEGTFLVDTSELKPEHSKPPEALFTVTFLGATKCKSIRCEMILVYKCQANVRFCDRCRPDLQIHDRSRNDSAKNSSKLRVMYPSLSVSYRLKTSVIRFRVIHACTKTSKLIPESCSPLGDGLPRLLLSNVVNKTPTKGWLSLYPNAIIAFPNSCRLIRPLPSSSNRSNNSRQEARNCQSPTNSSNPTRPFPSLSNIRTIIVTV